MNHRSPVFRLAASFFVFVLVALGLPGSARAFVKDVANFTLKNGMQVVVIPDHRAPVVTHMVWYKVGAADEPVGQAGIAHFLEHLMFKGTPANPNGAFSKYVASVGGQENAFTSSDYTAYFQRVAKEHLADMMRLEADRMENLVLTKDVVDPERDVIMEERRSRTDNNPSAQLSEALEATLWFEHPYGRPVIGWMNEMEKLSLEDAISYYDRYYTPNNAILIVAGDVNADEVKQLAEETYGKLERRAEPPPRLRPEEPVHRTHRMVRLESPLVTQPSLTRSYVVPSYTTADRKGLAGEAEALDLFAELLAGGSTSALYQKLVVEEKVAVSIGGYYRGTALDDGELVFFATPAPETTLEQLEAAIDREMAAFLKSEITEETLARVKRSVIATSVYAQDSQQTLARVFGTALTTGRSVEDVLGWTDRIRAVTADQILSVGLKYLDKNQSATGYLLPAPEASRS
ncbi:MAG: insulinase family protein [Rhodobiaceae bacterium]|nr:insulinase family protein [Rhodobiaceae bacterium]MCC0049012.1 insulinase family protein [Rhodobiaceae bacterium]